MTKIFLGIIASLILMFGVYFWISESRISKLQKTSEANIAKIAEQDKTIQVLGNRLNFVQTSTFNYQQGLQDIQIQVQQNKTEFQKKNVPVVALTNSAQATKDVNDHFDSIFSQLNAIGKPVVSGDKK